MHDTTNREPLLYQAACLSSGTIATLTGKRKYVDIDAIRLAFWQWVRDLPEPDKRFTCWQDAWNVFWPQWNKKGA